MDHWDFYFLCFPMDCHFVDFHARGLEPTEEGFSRNHLGIVLRIDCDSHKILGNLRLKESINPNRTKPSANQSLQHLSMSPHGFWLASGFKASTLEFLSVIPMFKPKKEQNSVELYFMEARAKLIDIAAFMDRVERDQLTDDFRYQAFKEALRELNTDNRAESVLLALSDPTHEPIPAATTKAACGAWPDKPR